MGELQQLVVGWLQVLVSLLPTSYALGAGMVSAVNPCGFPMLPAYLSLYLGAQEDHFVKRSVLARAGRALFIGVTVSLGFVLLFAGAGVIITAGGRALIAAMPWVGSLIGLTLVGLGALLLLGRSVYAPGFARLASHLGDPRNVSLRGFFLFGLAYGAASLSCTLPVFLVVVGSALSTGGFQSGLAQFLSYSLGMSLVLISLTLALAFFKHSLVNWLRQTVPAIQRASAALLILAGCSILSYWLIEGGLLRALVQGSQAG